MRRLFLFAVALDLPWSAWVAPKTKCGLPAEKGGWNPRSADGRLPGKASGQ